MRLAASVLLLLLGSLLSGCYSLSYFSDRMYAPAFTDAGQWEAVVAAKPQKGEGSPPLALAADVGFSPVRHIGITGSLRTVNQRHQRIYNYQNHYLSDSNRMDGRQFSGAIGYYRVLNERIQVELYAGLGSGTMRRESFMDSFDTYDGRYRLYTLQPTLNVCVGDKNPGEMQMGIRLAVQDLHHITGAAYRYSPQHAVLQTNVLPGKTALLEAFWGLNIPIRKLVWTTQIGCSGNYAGPKAVQGVSFYMSLGLGFRNRSKTWIPDRGF